jgi:histidinol dehydrogenase
MKFIDLSSEESASRTEKLDRKYIPEERLIDQVRGIVDQIRFGGDDALIRLVEQFDHTLFARDELRIDRSEIEEALGHLDPMSTNLRREVNAPIGSHKMRKEPKSGNDFTHFKESVSMFRPARPRLSHRRL